jgi:hypothetical protein
VRVFWLSRTDVGLMKPVEDCMKRSTVFVVDALGTRMNRERFQVRDQF